MNRNIPVLHIEGKTLPEVWEKAVIELWNKGIDIKTEYDKKEDPPSKDATAILVIHEPMAEPRIHRAFPGGLDDLEIYRQEVVDGVHDHWIKPEEGKWTYTYHKRLFDYEMEDTGIKQIDYIVEKLSEVPFSRRAQAITWNPKLDPPTEDPPCLQRIWCRLVATNDGPPGGEAGPPGGEASPPDGEAGFELNMNTHWRSRDAFKASFMNIFALTDLQGLIAGRIAEKIGKVVKVGRYVDITDSFHIYGSYKDEFKNFLNTVQQRSFAERTWTTEFALPFFEEGRKRLLEEKGK